MKKILLLSSVLSIPLFAAEQTPQGKIATRALQKVIAHKTSDQETKQLAELTYRIKNLPQGIQKNICSFDKNPILLEKHSSYQLPASIDLHRAPSQLYAKDGKVYIVYPQENNIVVRDVVSGIPSHIIPYQGGTVTCATAFECEGETYVMTGSEDKYVRIWNADVNPDKPCVQERIYSDEIVEPFEPIIDAHAYRTDQTYLAMNDTVSQGLVASVKPWKIVRVPGKTTSHMCDEGAQKFCIFPHQASLHTIASGYDNEVVVRNIDGDEDDATFQAFVNFVDANDHWYNDTSFCSYERNGKIYLIMGFENGGIAIFDPFAKPVKKLNLDEYFEDQGICLGKFIGHQAEVHSIIHFKRNGIDLFATAAKDGSVYVWEFGPGIFELEKNAAPAKDLIPLIQHNLPAKGLAELVASYL